jgi:adenylate kinase family enzyme
MEPHTVILLSRSGGGKGTQAEKLIEYFNKNNLGNIYHTQTGERIRNFLEKDTYSKDLAKKINDSGGLQPTFVSVWAWGGDLIDNVKEGDSLIIDGTPRRLVEAHILDEGLEFFRRDNIRVIFINVGPECAAERLKDRGRPDDDNQEKIDLKREWYERNVTAVVEYYKAHEDYLFHEVDGEQSVEEVHRDILTILGI